MKKVLKKVAVTMFLSLFLTACGNVKQEQQDINEYTYIEEKNNETHEIKLSESEIEEIKRKELIDEYSNYFNTYPVDYNYSDLYLSNEQIDQIIDCSKTTTHCEKGYELDFELFYSFLKENSQKYVKENPEFRLPFSEETYASGHSVSFEANLKYTINMILKEKNDINEDLHQIEGLTIVFGNASEFNSKSEGEKYLVYALEDDSILLGVYDPDQNIIVIDDEAIELVVSMYYGEEEQYKKFDEMLLKNLLHEFNHVRYKACECRVAQGLEMDNMFVYDDNYISTITEAAAESELYVLGKYPHSYSREFSDYSYESERSDELLLLTLALCNENVTIEDYYKALADTDYAALYEFYDLRSREEIYDFYKILYSIDSKNFRNNLWEKIYTEEELKDKTLFDYTVDVGYAYRVDTFRMALKKLTEYTNSKSTNLFTIEDNLAVFNVLKDIVVKDSYMYYEDDTDPDKVSYRKYYEEYMVENIAALENKYIEFLSNYYGISVSEIRDMEKNDIPKYIYALINLAKYKNVEKEDNDMAHRLFAKFPLLRALLKEGYISYYDYPDFVEDNQEIIYQK